MLRVVLCGLEHLLDGLELLQQLAGRNLVDTTALGAGVGLGLEENEVVDDGGDGGAEEGAHPVDPVVLPQAANDGCAEGAESAGDKERECGELATLGAKNVCSKLQSGQLGSTCLPCRVQRGAGQRDACVR